MRHETSVAIVGLFRREPRKSYAVREIAAKAGIAYCVAHSHTEELAKRGVLLMQRQGRSKMCSLNLKSREAKLLVALSGAEAVDKFLKAKPTLRPLFASLVEKSEAELKNSLHSIVLFGSYAKGAERADSDIDILFITSSLSDLRKLERVCNGLSMAYGRKIAPLVTDVEQMEEMLSAKGQTAGKEALLDGIILHGYERFYDIVFRALGE